MMRPRRIVGPAAGIPISEHTFRSTYPGRHVARERYPQRQVARDTPDLSLGNIANVVVASLTFTSVVGDTKGAVFGGLVEARLRPSTKKIYLVS
ncbi:hypothetical protein Tco_0762225 [Tanacetum coccineum]